MVEVVVVVVVDVFFFIEDKHTHSHYNKAYHLDLVLQFLLNLHPISNNR